MSRLGTQGWNAGRLAGVFAAALLSLGIGGQAAAASLAEWTAELRATFTVDRKPVPPLVFGDFGDDDLADSTHGIRVAIDVLAAAGSNLYAEPIGSDHGWVSQKTVRLGIGSPGESIAYRFVGATRNGLLVAIAALQTAGTGRFYTLHILDAVPARAFDDEGKLYDRLNLTTVRSVPLGDRWRGDVSIAGDTLTVRTEPGEPDNGAHEVQTRVIEAQRP